MAMSRNVETDLPPVIGHRGAAALAPENTLAGIRAAHAAGCEWIEFDVHLSGDGVAMVIHDEDLKRVAGVDLRVAESPAAELQRHDVGTWFGPEFSGERVPTLSEYLETAAGFGLGVNIEIKPAQGRETPTVLAVAEVTRAIWPTDLPVPLITSFSDAMLRAAAELAPDIRRSLLTEAPGRAWRKRADDVGAIGLHYDHRKISAADIAMTAAAGFYVAVYTVNERPRAEELWRWGAASVITDRPGDFLS